MSALEDFRAKYPGAYDDLSDQDLADKLYSKFYSDMPRDQFDSKIGIKSASTMDTIGDIALQTGNRLVGGVEDVGGIVGDVDVLVGRTGNWIGNRIESNFGDRTEDIPYDESKRITKGIFPTSDELKDATGYTERKPTTSGGRTFDKWAGPVVEAIPGAVTMGGGPASLIKKGAKELGSRITRGAVAPVAATNVAEGGLDYLGVDDPTIRDAAKLVAPVAGAVFAHGVKRPNIKGIKATAQTQAKSDIIEQAIRRAEERGIGKPLFNREAALRAEFARIIKNPTLFTKFSAAEQRAIRQTADGKLLERVLMRMGTYAPENLNFRAATPYIIASVLGVPQLGAAISGAAEGAKRITSEMTKRASKTTLGMVKEGKDRAIKSFPGVKPAIATGVYTAAQGTKIKTRKLDPKAGVPGNREWWMVDGDGKYIQGSRTSGPPPDKIPLVPGGKPVLPVQIEEVQ